MLRNPASELVFADGFFVKHLGRMEYKVFREDADIRVDPDRGYVRITFTNDPERNTYYLPWARCYARFGWG